MGHGAVAVVAVATLMAAAAGLVIALLIVVPAPSGFTYVVGVMAEGYSLVLAAYAVAGVTAAIVVTRLGARTAGLVAGLLALLTLGLAVVPVVQAGRTAGAEGAHLSLSDYFSRPAWTGGGAPAASATFARPGDGSELRLDVWRPSDSGGRRRSQAQAAVVVVHGGGWTSGSRGDTRRWNEWLAERGYVVFAIDYRLAPPARWRDATGDVKAAVGWVVAHAGEHGVDPARIGLLGFSAGGHLALLAGYTPGAVALPPSDGGPNHAVAVVAAVYPVTDLTAGIVIGRARWSDRRSDVEVRQLLGAAPTADPERARSASPVSHVNGRVPPTYLVHGRSDQIVPVAHSRRLAALLREAGVAHRYVELPGANHAYDVAWGAWSTQITRQTLGDFLAEHLPV